MTRTTAAIAVPPCPICGAAVTGYESSYGSVEVPTDKPWVHRERAPELDTCLLKPCGHRLPADFTHDWNDRVTTLNPPSPPEGSAVPTVAFAEPRPDGQYRTIRVPDYGPHLEILTLHWPISRDLLEDSTVMREAFADHAAAHLSERVRELITEWKPA